MPSIQANTVSSEVCYTFCHLSSSTLKSGWLFLLLFTKYR